MSYSEERKGSVTTTYSSEPHTLLEEKLTICLVSQAHLEKLNKSNSHPRPCLCCPCNIVRRNNFLTISTTMNKGL
jgi:hypothetical protein